MARQLPRLRQGGKEVLDKQLHDTVASRTTPAIFYLATNAKETVYSNQAGEVTFGDESSGQVHADSILELYSQTKLITCLAALQLVDRGLVNLDSTADVEKHLPELGDLPLLKGYGDDGKAIFGKPTKKATLRMLMSHTAGLVYAHSESPLSAYIKENPDDSEIFAANATIKTIAKPLVYEPGTSWLYSVSIDWVGKLVERASGERLDEYFQSHIFDPLGLKSFSFFPTAEVKKTKMSVCYRKPDGSVSPIPGGFGFNRPNEVDKVSTDLLLGGAGLFGTLEDYLAILRALLQSDPSSPHPSKNPIISAESFKELFAGCVSAEGKKNIVDMTSRSAAAKPAPSLDNVDYSCGFLLNLEDFEGRRKKGSGSWSGVAKTNFWIDPATGIAGICGTQLFAPAPDPWFGVYADYERTLYAQLE